MKFPSHVKRKRPKGGLMIEIANTKSTSQTGSWSFLSASTIFMGKKGTHFCRGVKNNSV